MEERKRERKNEKARKEEKKTFFTAKLYNSTPDSVICVGKNVY